MSNQDWSTRLLTSISNMPLPDTLVVANGTLQSDAPDYIRQAKHILICDGALGQYVTVAGSRTPDLVIGDGDSVDPDLLQELGVAFTHVSDEEINDLTKAVHEALHRGWRDLHIIGGTGRREDHTLGNIFLLPDYLEEGARVAMHTEYGVFVPFRGTMVVEGMRGHEVSFFDIDRMPMSASGVAYPFVQRSFPALWQATLNHITEHTMTVSSDGRALLYLSKSKRKEYE